MCRHSNSADDEIQDSRRKNINKNGLFSVAYSPIVCCEDVRAIVIVERTKIIINAFTSAFILHG